MTPGLGVLLAAEGERPLDEQSLAADVAPSEREGLAGPQPGVGKYGDQRRVARPQRGAHGLNACRRQRAYLLAPRSARLADESRGIGGDPFGLNGALQNGSEQL